MTELDDIREPHLRHDDFLGAFAILERDGHYLMVQNRRHIGGRDVLTWDLPGGQVEPGERLVEALRRELREELGVEIEGEPRFCFYQEGERRQGEERRYVWRSFFFRITGLIGEPRPQDDVLDWRMMPKDALKDELHAPYHQSFLHWVDGGGNAFQAEWCD